MKNKIINLKYLFFLFLFSSNCISLFSQNKENKINKNNRIIVAYVTSWSDIIPNPELLTHINYAFAHVTDDFVNIRIDNTDRLKQIEIGRAHV